MLGEAMPAVLWLTNPCSGWVNLRDEPSLSSPKTGQLYSGQWALTYPLGKRDGWLYVEHQGAGLHGWVSSSLVQAEAYHVDLFADGYDAPVGTLDERRSMANRWPGAWLDASPFGRLYLIGTSREAYHTGADLNLPRDADAHSNVVACADGVVSFAGKLPVWGNMVVVRHDPLVGKGRVLYSRYGHVERIGVGVGQRVERGQRLASVGNAEGAQPYHLHFDLSHTNILQMRPQHWPGRNLAQLKTHYIDPLAWITHNRPAPTDL